MNFFQADRRDMDSRVLRAMPYRLMKRSRNGHARRNFIGLLGWVAAVAFLVRVLGLPGELSAGEIDYDRDVRPILSEKCFACHGPDAAERQGGFRLDQSESTRGEADSGAIPIVPGNPEASELMARILSENDSLRMPPDDTGKSLQAAEKAILAQWIREGAEYQQLWSLIPPTRPAIPAVQEASWLTNTIDAFILARLEREGLHPAPEADRATLIRRVTLDLTGLPPQPEEIDAFLADTAPDAYLRLVDRLLASPRYGERLALDWLDAARYADTHGYHIDSGRDMTLWRKWVIDSFNRNQPFDQFTIEQLAGDLIPDATLEQRVASGFNRNHMINFEGGAIPEEYHAAYIVDRVNTTSTVWLGLTVACAQCHDHKYDPISQRDYYQLYAFFHNVPERGLDGSRGNAAPMIPVPTAEHARRQAQLRAEIAERAARLEKLAPKATEAPRGKQNEDESASSAGLGKGRAEVKSDESQPDASPREAERTRIEEELQLLRGQLEQLEKEIPTAMIMQEMDSPRETYVLIRGEYDKRGERVEANVPASLPSLPAGRRPDRLALAEWLIAPEQPLTARVTVNRYWQMLFGTGLVKTSEDFGSQGERPTHPALLDWLAVEFREPSSLSRGAGANDLGRTAGDAPTPWDVKRLIRLMVTSSTYRQASFVSPDVATQDPENRLLARGARFRLPAELIRDLALSVSGLLDPRIGGPSVSPYQPEGLWDELASRADGKNWTAQTYVQSHGIDLYRRSMYTFWKRTSPPPSLSTFDAPDRETCSVRRARTNTPLQALVLMNDPTYVEASRKLAERIMTESGSEVADRIEFAFRLVTARKPQPHELAILEMLFREQWQVYRRDVAAAEKLLSVGEAPRRTDLSVAELAAWTVVASALLNLDEAITKG